MKYSVISIVTCVTLLFGCVEEKIIDIGFGEITNIKGKSVKIQGSDNIVMPAKIIINNNKLILFQPIKSEMFTVLDLDSMSCMYTYGDVGKSSKEFFTPVNGQNIIKCRDAIEVYENGKIHRLIFTDTVNHSVDRMSIRADMVNLNAVNKINTDKYYCINPFPEKDEFEYVMFDKNGENPHYFGEYPKWSNKDDVIAPMEYMKTSLYSETEEKIVSFYYNYPRYKFFDKDGKLLSIFGIENSYKIGDEKIFFAEPFLSEKYIYVLFANISKMKMREDINNYKPKLIVLDWAGKIIATYQMDKPVITFTVKDDSKVYCAIYPSNNETDILYEYDLPII